MIRSALDHRVLWVGGKGGVGKTTVSASLGILASQQGKRCLVISTDPAHSLGDAFARDLDDQPRRVLPDLDAMEINPDEEVDRHLDRVLGQMRQYAASDMIPELERQLKMTRQSPGTQEAALLEKIARLITENRDHYDLLIFDTAPTGHTLRLLSLPEAMAAWTEGLLRHNRKSEELGKVMKHLTPNSGRDIATPFDDPQNQDTNELDKRSRGIADALIRRRRLFHQARRIITDPTQSGFFFVLTPERLPILETRRAVKTLDEVGVPVTGVIINRVLPDNADGEFLRARREQEKQYLTEISNEFRQLPSVRLPLLPTDVQGISGLETVAALLETTSASSAPTGA